MNESVKRELLVAAGNILLLKLVGQALREGRLSQMDFEVIARFMELVLKTYEAAYPVSTLDATVDDKMTRH